MWRKEVGWGAGGTTPLLELGIHRVVALLPAGIRLTWQASYTHGCPCPAPPHFRFHRSRVGSENLHFSQVQHRKCGCCQPGHPVGCVSGIRGGRECAHGGALQGFGWDGSWVTPSPSVRRDPGGERKNSRLMTGMSSGNSTRKIGFGTRGFMHRRWWGTEVSWGLQMQGGGRGRAAREVREGAQELEASQPRSSNQQKSAVDWSTPGPERKRGQKWFCSSKEQAYPIENKGKTESGCLFVRVRRNSSVL